MKKKCSAVLLYFQVSGASNQRIGKIGRPRQGRELEIIDRVTNTQLQEVVISFLEFPFESRFGIYNIRILTVSVSKELVSLHLAVRNNNKSKYHRDQTWASWSYKKHEYCQGVIEDYSLILSRQSLYLTYIHTVLRLVTPRGPWDHQS